MLYHHLPLRFWVTSSSLSALVISELEYLFLVFLHHSMGFLDSTDRSTLIWILGYFAVDIDSTPEKLVFNRTVTLRDSFGKAGTKWFSIQGFDWVQRRTWTIQFCEENYRVIRSARYSLCQKLLSWFGMFAIRIIYTLMKWLYQGLVIYLLIKLISICLFPPFEWVCLTLPSN